MVQSMTNSNFQNEQTSHKHLLTCFFTESEKALSFLEEDHGFQTVKGLSEYQKGRQLIRPFGKNDSVVPPFWASIRYEKKDVSLELNYREEDFSLECMTYFNQTNRLELHSLLNAAQKSYDFTPGLILAQSQLLRGEIQALAQTIQEHHEDILLPEGPLIKKATLMREKQMEALIREHYQKELETARVQAAKAFQDENYTRVVEIYTPYEVYLPPADQKKLDKARAHILSS